MITQEEKAKIFALYWGQEIAICHNYLIGEDRNTKVDPYNIHRTKAIQVKPLSQISDEDALEVCKMAIPYTGRYEIVKVKETSIVFKLPFIGIMYQVFPLRCLRVNLMKDGTANPTDFAPCNNVIKIIDFLRSKGYALPYMNYSVEELVKEGVFKLIEQ